MKCECVIIVAVALVFTDRRIYLPSSREIMLCTVFALHSSISVNTSSRSSGVAKLQTVTRTRAPTTAYQTMCCDATPAKLLCRSTAYTTHTFSASNTSGPDRLTEHHRVGDVVARVAGLLVGETRDT
jgi:hypothetical protein